MGLLRAVSQSPVRGEGSSCMGHRRQRIYPFLQAPIAVTAWSFQPYFSQRHARVKLEKSGFNPMSMTNEQHYDLANKLTEKTFADRVFFAQTVEQKPTKRLSSLARRYAF